jgi:PhnB protein
VAGVNTIPDGYPRVSPSLVVDGAAAALDFYCAILGATVRLRMDGPDGRIGHAEVEVGDSVIMVSDEFPEMGFRGPRSVGGTAVTIAVYVDDVDDAFARALAAGATEVQPLADQFYGDRSGQFEDPWGHRWSLQTHIEDVAPEEMMRRAAAVMGGGSLP